MIVKNIPVEVRVEIFLLEENGPDPTTKKKIEFTNLTKDLVMVSVDKNLHDSAGTFSILLAPSVERDIAFTITPMSFVRIYFNNRIKMMGFVDNIVFRGGLSGKDPDESTYITGRDMSKLFIEQRPITSRALENISFLTQAQSGKEVSLPPSILFFQKAAKDLILVKQSKVFKILYDAIYGSEDAIYDRNVGFVTKRKRNVTSGVTDLTFSLGSGGPFSDFFDQDFRFVSNNFILNDVLFGLPGMFAEDVNIIDLWNTFAVPPIVELFYDTIPANTPIQTFNKLGGEVGGISGEGTDNIYQATKLQDVDGDKFAMIARPNPLIDSDEFPHFRNLPFHVIDRGNLIDVEINKTDGNTKNWLYVDWPVYGGTFANTFQAKHSTNNESIIRHGLKPLPIHLKYIILGNDNITSVRNQVNESIRNQVNEPDPKKKNAVVFAKIGKIISDAMLNVYGIDYKLFSGVINVTTDNDYRIGEKIIIDFPKSMEFYIESVTDRYQYPSISTTTLMVTRGREVSKEKLSAPGGNRIGNRFNQGTSSVK